MTAVAPALRATGRRHFAIAATAARQELQERAALVGRLLFYGVILMIFWRLWQTVLEGGAVRGVAARDLLWYLAITEWVMLSVPAVYLDIERDVRSGDIACALVRPVSYLGQQLSAALGAYAVRSLVLAVAGLVMATWLAGGLPTQPESLIFALPLGLVAGALVVVLSVAIGLCALWLQDTSPVYWVWQKPAFVLGGLLLPLEIYPDWLRRVAELSPFSALLHGPGRMAFGPDLELVAWTALRLVVWGAVFALFLRWLNERGLRALELNGG